MDPLRGRLSARGFGRLPSLMTADLPTIRVQPGQLYLARSPAILQTILGSCVSVTFWSARFGSGALCHGVLPKCPRGVDGPEGHRYVDFSIRYLAKQFDAFGASRPDLQVRVFGGADVLPLIGSSKPTIGGLNCRMALEVLADEGFSPITSDLGGICGRTIQFHTGTGAVLVHRLAKSSNPLS